MAEYVIEWNKSKTIAFRSEILAREKSKAIEIPFVRFIINLLTLSYLLRICKKKLQLLEVAYQGAGGTGNLATQIPHVWSGCTDEPDQKSYEIAAMRLAL